MRKKWASERRKTQNDDTNVKGQRLGRGQATFEWLHNAYWLNSGGFFSRILTSSSIQFLLVNTGCVVFPIVLLKIS